MGPGMTYPSGWQVAADANLAGRRIPTSLYPANSVQRAADQPGTRVRTRPSAGEGRQRQRNGNGNGNSNGNARRRMHRTRSRRSSRTPRPASAAAQRVRADEGMIEAGAAVHFEDQPSSEKKCGHWRQGACSDLTFHQRSCRRAARGRRADADRARRAHRGQREAHTSDVDPRDREFPTATVRPRDSSAIAGGIECDRSRCEYGAVRGSLCAKPSTPDSRKRRSSPSACTRSSRQRARPLTSPSFNWKKSSTTPRSRLQRARAMATSSSS